MSEYQPRIVEAQIADLMSGITALAIEGPKGVGKTATASRFARTTIALDVPDEREAFASDPDRLSTSAEPILIDEWQRFPPAWDYVRRAVDDNRRPGRFLLTGSAVPLGVPLHSGAGRIVTVRMRPMSVFERNLAQPTVSLAGLLSGARPPIDGKTSIGLPDYVDAITTSGFPWLQGATARTVRSELDSYLARIAQREFAELGRPVRNPALLTRWMRAYAAATSTTASFERIRDASTAGHGEKPARSTTIPYRDALESLWIVEPVPAWLPISSRTVRLATASKHQLADPAFAARLLDVDRSSLLSGKTGIAPVAGNATLLGALFESLVTLCVRVYAQAAEASSVSHLRTRAGEHDVDLIVEGPDGRVLALEVKLTSAPEDKDVRHLHWLRSQIGDNLLDAAVITTGPYAYRRKDGIAVIPAALLGP